MCVRCENDNKGMNKTPAPPFTFAGPAYTECMQAKRMVSLSLDDDQYLI